MIKVKTTILSGKTKDYYDPLYSAAADVKINLYFCNCGAAAGTLNARIKREAVGTGPNVRTGSYSLLTLLN